MSATPRATRTFLRPCPMSSTADNRVEPAANDSLSYQIHVVSARLGPLHAAFACKKMSLQCFDRRRSQHTQVVHFEGVIVEVISHDEIGESAPQILTFSLRPVSARIPEDQRSRRLTRRNVRAILTS